MTIIKVFGVGRRTTHSVLIDDEDYQKVIKYSWTVHKSKHAYYARATIKNKTVKMHRLIMNAPKDTYIDHINSNGLDNRKCNLRFATNSQNQQNKRKHASFTSKYKGVHWYTKDERWRVEIKLKGRSYYLGMFKDEEKAARSYDRAARRLFNEFAYLNFPDSETNCHEEALEENERKKRTHPNKKRASG